MKKTSMLIIAGIFLIGFTLMSFNLPGLGKEEWEIPEKYKKMENPYEGDKSLERIGKMMYAKNCKSCHGNQGQGDGPRAKQIEAEMYDLTTAEFHEKYSDGEIYYMSFIGRDEMPNFESAIPEEEDRWAVVNYIRSMKK